MKKHSLFFLATRLLLCIAILNLFCCVTNKAVLAAQNPDPRIFLPTVTASKGAVVTVPIAINSFQSISSYGITIAFDPAVLAPLPAAAGGGLNGDILAAANFAYNDSFTDRSVRVGNYAASGSATGSILATVKFVIHAAVTSGTETELVIVSEHIYDGNNVRLQVDLTAGKVILTDTGPDVTAGYDKPDNFTAPVSRTPVAIDAERDLTAGTDAMGRHILLTLDSRVALVNNVQSMMDVAPFIRPEVNRTMVPVRFVSEYLGAGVAWLPGTRQVRILHNGKEIILTIGSDTAMVNGKAVNIDSPAGILSERTFVPLRFVSEILGATVGWDGKTRSIAITAK